jgi:hypothetical protein
MLHSQDVIGSSGRLGKCLAQWVLLCCTCCMLASLNLVHLLGTREVHLGEWGYMLYVAHPTLRLFGVLLFGEAMNMWPSV